MGNVISGAMGIFTGREQAQATKDAATTQANAANQATRLTSDMYQQNYNAQAPYRGAGYSALAQLQYLLGMKPTAWGGMAEGGENGVNINRTEGQNANQNAFMAAGGDPEMAAHIAALEAQWDAEDRAKAAANGGTPIDYSGFQPTGKFGELSQSFGMDQFKEDPGYQFRIDQANKALQRSAAAKGGLLSGGTLKGLADYNQGAASQEYQNAYNRFSNDQTSRYNRLAALAGIGQTATNISGQLGAQAAGQMGEYGLQGANARAAGTLGQANVWGNVMSGLGQSAENYGNWNRMQDYTGGGRFDDARDPSTSTNPDLYKW